MGVPAEAAISAHLQIRDSFCLVIVRTAALHRRTDSFGSNLLSWPTTTWHKPGRRCGLCEGLAVKREHRCNGGPRQRLRQRAGAGRKAVHDRRAHVPSARGRRAAPRDALRAREQARRDLGPARLARLAAAGGRNISEARAGGGPGRRRTRRRRGPLRDGRGALRRAHDECDRRRRPLPRSFDEERRGQRARRRCECGQVLLGPRRAARRRRRPGRRRAPLCGNQPVCRVREQPASPRHRAGVASMAWRTTR